KKKYDTALEQNVEVYHDQVVVTLPVASAPKAFTIAATHQGCAEKGLCYPPQPRAIHVALKAFGADADSVQVTTPDDAGGAPGAPAATPAPLVDTPPAMSLAPGATTGNSLRASMLGGGATSGRSAGGGATDAATPAVALPDAGNPTPKSAGATAP